MEAERFLVTGAGGCIGAWTVARLTAGDVEVVAFDVSDDRRRLGVTMGRDATAAVDWVTGDIRDHDAILALVRDRDITHIVHLAALQVPFCQADPVRGAQVNVTGTVNILEAMRRSDGAVRGLAYASSVAVFGPPEEHVDGRAGDSAPVHPTTLYGVYKVANEGTARIYADDWGVGSVGLRPCVVYGPGRDQGLTSDPTTAMLAAAAGRPAHIAFGGSSTFHHADDVAATFVAAARLESRSALVHTMGGVDASIEEFARLIDERSDSPHRVTFGESPLPIPATVDGAPLDALLGSSVAHRSLVEGIDDTMTRFEALLRSGRIRPPGG